MKFISIKPIACGLLLVLALTGHQAKATPIAGSITFNGIANTNSGDLINATSFSSISGVTVVATDTGNYAGLAGNAVTFTPFIFSSGGVSPLWTFTAGGITYSFTATSIVVTTQTASFLNLSGSGIASETGYTNTVGTWTITDTGNGAPSFSFGAGATVPDAGTTALLMTLGLAAVAMGLFYQTRKFVRA